ncbi:hypothetical protein MNBD_CHLOROFLEXI01-89 [hydrothermal vent metagenome]|uniref:Uncharacterized protein n=1 Tax=hydrothermal vent metagenome TaxID=652676 RepID=A0A3B0VG10_9ZZZZ
MKIKLHRPRRALWNVTVIIFLLSLAGFFLGVPVLDRLAYFLMLLAASLLILGTWVI